MDITTIISETECRPFIWSPNDTETGSRIGGLPPEGVIPPPGEDTRYLMTLEFAEGLEVSMFAQRLREQEPPADWFYAREYTGQLFPNDDVLSFIVHGSSWRAKTSQYASELEPHRIVLMDVIKDTWEARFSLRDDMTGPFVTRPARSLRLGDVGVPIYRQKSDHVLVTEVSRQWAKACHFRNAATPPPGCSYTSIHVDTNVRPVI